MENNLESKKDNRQKILEIKLIKGKEVNIN